MSWLLYHAARSADAGRLIFWRRAAAGYTDNLLAAGDYTEEYAKRVQDLSHGESKAVPRALIDTLIQRLIVDLGDAENRAVLEARP